MAAKSSSYPPGPPMTLGNMRRQFGLTAHRRLGTNVRPQPFGEEAASTNALRYFEKGHLRVRTTDWREPGGRVLGCTPEHRDRQG